MAVRSVRRWGLWAVLTLALGSAAILVVSHAPNKTGMLSAAVQWALDQATPARLMAPALEFLVLLPLALLVEGLAVGWRFCSLRRLLFKRTMSSRTDVLFFVIFLLRLPRVLMKPLRFLGITGLALLGNGALASHLGFGEYTTIENFLVGIVVFWLIRDLGYYWHHRLQHMRPLWPLHRMHHGARQMNVVTVYRNNFFGDILLAPLMMLPLSLVTLPASSIFAGQLLLVFHGYLIHSEWRADWGWIGRWVIQSPLHHRLHHGMRHLESRKNYATLPLWDRLFGTFAEPETRNIVIGVSHTGYDTVLGSIGMLFRDLGETARAFLVPLSARRAAERAGGARTQQ